MKEWKPCQVFLSLTSMCFHLQAIESYNQSKETSNNMNKDDNGTFISEESVNNDQKSTSHPNFEIILERKFEISELCKIFFNRWVKYLYMFIVTLGGFLACWAFSTVFGSAWASNIPLNFGMLHQCSHDAFHHQLLPTGSPELDSCRNAYHFCLFLFSLIVIPLSLLELKEQAFIQMCLGVLRFATVTIIIIYCIVKIAEVGDICGRAGNETQINTSSLLNDTQYYSNTSILVQSVTIRDIIFKFDWRGWLIAMPVITYAFNVHMGIPSLTHPIKQKQYLHWLIMFAFGSIAFAYLSLGIVAPLWFRATIQETVTLNWVSRLLFLCVHSEHTMGFGQAPQYLLSIHINIHTCSADRCNRSVYYIQSPQNGIASYAYD